MLFLVPTIFASLSFPPDNPADVKVSCFDSQKDLCSSSVNCNITILYPNGSTLVAEQPMSFNANYFNYTTETLVVKGEYNSIVACDSGATNGYKSFAFYVTNYPVIQGSSNQGIVAIGILASILLISVIFMGVGFKFSGQPISLFFILMSFIFILITVMMGYNYASDILVSDSASGFQFMLYRVLFWGLFAVALITLTFLTMKTIGEIRERKSLIDYGEGYNSRTGNYE